MSHFKPYSAYKDSGAEWAGQVPGHWDCKKLMYWISGGYGSGTTPSDESYYAHDGYGVAWLTTGELRENTIYATGKYVTEDGLASHSALKVHPVDSLVIAMYGATIGRLGVLGIEATLNQACFAIHPCKALSTKFLRYWFEGFRNELVELGTGAGQPNISGDKIRNLRLSAPSDVGEQMAIVSRLDRETARIDALVEKKTRFIELLREKRQALITHVVTKGFDSTAKMKDTGVEWLGEVPQDWSVTKIKRIVLAISQGWSPECDPRVPESDEWGVLKVGCVNGGEFKPSESKALPVSLEPRAQLALKKGDVLVSRANTRELVGSCAVVDKDYPKLMLCDKLYRLLADNKKVLPEFLAKLIAVHGRKAVEIEATGASSSMVNISQSVILDLAVALPSISEQENILWEVRSSTFKIDGVIEKTERSIELLKERRSALITAAVTGQIDLREAA